MVEIDEKQIFAIIQKSKEAGSVKIGANEVTKAIERGQAQLVAFAGDVSPAEIVAHFPGLCKEMKVPCAKCGTKAELGASVGIKSTTAIAVTDAGSAKKELEVLKKELLGEEGQAQASEAKSE
ncbi:MAG: ribosomal L7Ae/L30e/S12e/Gadd45 family protein [Candidatus Woesearchaeota archaeon]|nr:ribosomal L7Ae/L30e/S12e/Gadd45 family protein [Nanoarchaeota archaeon]USN44492.1 MAG: ribosomal L7Ae/L30e/S12e/Gadd45 family protein [Candidatus Woesearchaeota archaeon]